MARYRVVGVDLPNRRRDRRNILPPIELVIEGEAYSTVNWSLGGFLIAPFAGAADVGDHIQVEIVVRIGDVVRRHRAEAEVVRRHHQRRRLAANYTRLTPETIDTLEGVITGRLRRAQR